MPRSRLGTKPTAIPIAFENARYYIAGDQGRDHRWDPSRLRRAVGGAGNDTFVPYGSGSNLDGRGGTDTLMLPVAATDYDFAQQNDGSILVSGTGGATWTIATSSRSAFHWHRQRQSMTG